MVLDFDGENFDATRHGQTEAAAQGQDFAQAGEMRGGAWKACAGEGAGAPSK